MKKIGILAGILFLLAGCGMGYGGYYLYKKGTASKTWPTVTGKVSHSSIEKHRSTSREKGRTRTSTTYSADILYDYTVNGKTYSSGKIGFVNSSSSSRASAQNKANKYPVGKSVTVFYDPEDPETALLEPGVSILSSILMGAGVLFGLIGIGAIGGMAVVWARGGAKPSEDQAAEESFIPEQDPPA